MNSGNTYYWFRKIALTEGISYLALLLIAMPLKYMAGYPMPVTIIGGLHGLLFVAFIIMSLEVKREYKRDFAWLVKAFIASIIPFGTFVMDKQWKRESVTM